MMVRQWQDDVREKTHCTTLYIWWSDNDKMMLGRNIIVEDCFTPWLIHDEGEIILIIFNYLFIIFNYLFIIFNYLLFSPIQWCFWWRWNYIYYLQGIYFSISILLFIFRWRSKNKFLEDNKYNFTFIRNIIVQHYINDGQTMTRWC